MPGSIKKTAVVLALQTAAGTPATPTAAANAVAIRVKNLKLGTKVKKAARDVITSSYGNDDQVPYSHVMEDGTFSVELAASGTAGTAPAWGQLIQMCAFAELVVAPGTGIIGRVEYTPIKSAIKSATIWAEQFGRVDRFFDCEAAMKISAKVGEIPSLDITGIKGLVTSITGNATLGAAPTLTAWQRAFAVGATNTGQMRIGVGVSYANGDITGGNTYNFTSYDLDGGQDVQLLEQASVRTIDHYDAAPKIEVTLDLTPTAFQSMKEAEAAGSQIGLGFKHGPAVGKSWLIYHPRCNIMSVEDVATGPVYTVKMMLEPMESSPGASDWVRIVSL